MGFLKNLTFTQGNSELVDSEFFVPVPDGFHACLDQAVIGEARSIVIVPKDYSFYDDPMEAEFALSIQANPFSIPKPMAPKNKDVYIQVLQQNSSLFNENPVLDIRIREGAGTLCQFAWGTDWLKIFGVFFAGTQGYIFHLMWNFQTLSGNAQEMVEAFYKQAKRWLERIHLPGEEESPRFRFATPDEGLYPHYEHIRSASRGLPGVVMVVNANGTEYEFIPLKNEDNDVSKKIAAVPLEPFSLSDTAWEMAGIFRVDKSVFDSKHDRECQLKNRYMHRAYMMSALRSFFWTVSTYCEDNAITPEQLTRDDVSGIVDHIAAQQWLNYCNNDHGSCICSIQDFHVYYVPKKTDMEDQRALMIADLAQNTGSFPSDLTYLDDLRDDLEYVYPAIHIIYDELAENRDPYQQLTGNKADVLYAWCALTIAAKEPFYAEDGPMNCWFEQCTDAVTHSTAAKHTASPRTTSTSHTTRKSLTAEAREELSNQGFEIDENNILQDYYSSSSGNKSNIVIPDGVQGLGDSCFYNSTAIVSITIPDSVTFIESSSFENCTSLKSVMIPGSVASIGDWAFQKCTSLKSVTISDGVTSIGDGAFDGCTSLTSITIPDSVTSLGRWLFDDCNNPTIHCSVDSYAAKYAAANGITCELTKATKSASGTKRKKSAPTPTTDFSIDGTTLFKYVGTGGAVVVPEGVTKIKAFAFDESNITSITLPQSLKEIAKYAFADCKQLKKIDLPNSVTSVSEYVFSNCTSLKSATWSKNAKTVPSHAFNNCKSLVQVRLPEGVTEIAESAFYSCEKLSDIYLPTSLCEIGRFAFLMTDKVTLHVPPDSFAEQYADAEGMTKQLILLTPEEKAQQEAERKRLEEERLRREAEEAERKHQEEERLRREAEEAERKHQEEERLRREAEEAERKRQEALAERRNHYDELSNAISHQAEIIAHNKGWFGTQAKARKNAQEQLAILQAQLLREFPNGKP